MRWDFFGYESSKRRTNFSDSNSKANIYFKFSKGNKRIIKKDSKNVIKINYKRKRDGDVLLNYASIRKAKKELLFKPKINIKKGLDYTYRYYKELLK